MDMITVAGSCVLRQTNLTYPSFRANAATPVPTTLPRITWRAGLDLDPVDISDPNQVAWLEALVWPEQMDRLVKLRAAIRIAEENKPRVVKGDLRTDLAGLVAEAPKDATLVVFHTAVLAYIRSPTEREEFARSVRSLCDFWISNESPRVLPEIADRAGNQEPKGRFLMSVNGVPVGWTDPHGASLDWISQLPDVLSVSDSNVAGLFGQ